MSSFGLAPPRRSAREDLLDDVAPFRGASLEDHARALEALSALAAEQIAWREDPEKVLAWQDPVPEPYAKWWRDIIAQRRRDQTANTG